MIRIQKLKQPKKISGKELLPGKKMEYRGVEIKNKTKATLYIDYYERKKPSEIDL